MILCLHFLVLDTPKLQSGESQAFSFFALKSYNYLGFEIGQAIFLDSCSQGKEKSDGKFVIGHHNLIYRKDKYHKWQQH